MTFLTKFATGFLVFSEWKARNLVVETEDVFSGACTVCLLLLLVCSSTGHVLMSVPAINFLYTHYC